MTATDTYLLLRAFCDELARCGLEHACTSPGSRCTPIVLSLVRQPGIHCYSHMDERCSGFFALGSALTSGRPAAITCTSGTAAANLAPAVIEAFQASVPLIVLTADRPPELRDIGAGQTIDQLKLYGDAAKWFFEVDVHDATPERLRWIRTLACRAYWTALHGRPGPVHLNFALREPLVLSEPLQEDSSGRGGGQPFVSFDAPEPGAPIHGAHPFGRIVIVAGRASPADPQAAARLAEFAEQARVPLLADALSGARRGPAAIAYYDALLRDPAFAQRHRPQFVIRVGDLPTSKPLRAWLASLDDLPQIAIDPNDAWQDPDSVVGMRVSAPYRTLLEGLRAGEVMADQTDWLDAWRAADEAAGRAIAQTLGEELSEPLVARGLGEWLPAGCTLFVASSMPVRDVESFLGASDPPLQVLSNRGANGIDGTVSSAFGVAASTEGPVVALIGDVALLHDIGGLLAARRLGLKLTILVLNNDGGGIFHFLPVAGELDAFEEHVATPHGLDFAKVAALYGLRYERPSTVHELGSALQEALRAPESTIVEVRTDRSENLALHRRIDAAVQTTLANRARV
jgi:2-succinyl-5-enolpyruvyl-6-hydroxy-3-cyclohexene-1-carboxylate synthase